MYDFDQEIANLQYARRDAQLVVSMAATIANASTLPVDVAAQLVPQAINALYGDDGEGGLLVSLGERLDTIAARLNEVAQPTTIDSPLQRAGAKIEAANAHEAAYLLAFDLKLHVAAWIEAISDDGEFSAESAARFLTSVGGPFDHEWLLKRIEAESLAAQRRVREEWQRAVNTRDGGFHEAVAAEATHTPEFTAVFWNGHRFDFSARQADCIKALWQAFENKTPILSQREIQDAAEVDSEIRNLFRGHPAWGTLILSPKKGRYRLAFDDPA